jgi:hypothetical protein
VFDTTAEADLYYEVINPPAHQEQEGVITKGEHKSEEARGSRRDKGTKAGSPRSPRDRKHEGNPQGPTRGAQGSAAQSVRRRQAVALSETTYHKHSLTCMTNDMCKCAPEYTRHETQVYACYFLLVMTQCDVED